VGAVLLGHLNRANPHARALTEGEPAVAVFQGPHGYVSPVLYERTPAAPTWDYTAVHVHGTVELVTDVEQSLAIVRATAESLEARHGDGWRSDSSLEYFRRIVPGVLAFRLRVDTVDLMAKLSQEQDPQTRARVAESFERRPGGGADLARMIREQRGGARD
jgi:transcriptional regulator